MKKLTLLLVIALCGCSSDKEKDLSKLSDIYLKLEIAKQSKSNYKDFNSYKDSLLSANGLTKSNYDSVLKEIFSQKETLESFHDSVYSKLNRLKENYAKKDSLGGT